MSFSSNTFERHWIRISRIILLGGRGGGYIYAVPCCSGSTMTCYLVTGLQGNMNAKKNIYITFTIVFLKN